MESRDRGFRDRIRDLRHHRSRSRQPDTENAKDEKKAGDTVPAKAGSVPATSQGGSKGLSVSPDPTQADRIDQSSSSQSSTALLAARSRDGPGTSTDRSATEECDLLWKKAYDELRVERPPLLEHYEAVLKDSAGLPLTSNFRDQLADIATAQSKKVTNKQWRFRWLGKQRSARETAERILDLTSRSASLVSAGMSLAPPYVSIPWAAVTALIPFMMNDIKEHRASMDGLEAVSRLTFSYQMAERAFLDRVETRDLYTKSVMSLYKKIIEYQALAVEYFGQSTLHRLGKNIVGSTQWQDMPSTISALDLETQRSLQFLGQQTQIESLATITSLLTQQQSEAEALMRSVASKRDDAAQVYDWISAVSVQRDHHDVRQKLGDAHLTSGDWFLEDSEVKSWRDWSPAGPCLWLRDGVGTGKSSMTSVLVEELNNSADGPVAFFYCSRKVDKHDERSTARSNHENVLRAILAQCAVALDGITVADSIVKRFNRDPRRILAGAGLSADECVSLLDEIFSSQSDSRHTIIVDALDECDDYDLLLGCLQDASQANENVRLFFSSRLQVKVQDYFPEARPVAIRTRNAEDIERFLDIEIPRRRNGSGMTDSQSDRLRKVLVERAGGMFMWVKLQLNLFLHEIKSRRIRLEEDIEPKLLSLERSEADGEEQLYGAYDDVYKSAVGDSKELRRKEIVITALRWVLSAFRTLTLRELAYATSVRSDGSVASTMQESLILDFCSNLLIEDTAGIIRLAHLSVRNYLEARTPPDFDERLSHQQAALTCLYFVNSPRYHEIDVSKVTTIQQENVTLTKGFYSYVTSNWHKHCRLAQKNEKIEELMDRFVTTSKSNNQRPEKDKDSASSREYSSDSNNAQQEIFESLLNALEIIDQDGNDTVTQYIARGGDLSLQNHLGNTLLHEAVRLCLSTTVQTLVGSGAPLNARNLDGDTALHLACIYRGHESLKYLLHAGADKNPRNAKSETPLHTAIAYGFYGAVEILLSANADAVAKDHQGNTPFHYAIYVEHQSILELLLLSGYDSGRRNEAGYSALSLALKMKKSKLAEMLLKHTTPLTPDNLMELLRIGGPEMAHLLAQNIQLQEGNNQATATMSKADHTYNMVANYKGLTQPCQHCDFVRWTIGSGRGSTYRHFDSLQDLYDSAEKGCPVCAFFKDELTEDHGHSSSKTEGRLTVTIEPGHVQGQRLDSKDKLLFSVGDTVLLTYELCTDSGDGRVLGLDWLTGRIFDESPTTPRSLTTIRSWISACDTTHDKCRPPAGLTLPFRVLEVGSNSDSEVRLIWTSERESDKFAYLSYTWGTHGALILQTRNIKTFAQGIPLASLGRTHKDAIVMTRLLGLRYLWVDALCIIQDSAQDFQQEAPRMSRYYRDAAVVLVAAAGHGMALGMLHTRQQPKLEIGLEPESITGSQPVRDDLSGRVYLRRPLQTAYDALLERILSRGWLVPEVTLARKLLIVGADQNYWHCQTCVRSEGSRLEQNPVLNLLPRTPSNRHTDCAQSFAPWYNFLHMYSSANFTRAQDRAVALTDMRNYFDPNSTHSEGMWIDDFRNGVLWHVDGSPSALSARRDIAPTWSWLSIDKGVRYYLLAGVQHDLLPHDMSFRLLEPYPRSSPLEHPRTATIDNPLLAGSSSTAINYARVEAMTVSCSRQTKPDLTCFLDNLKFEQAWQSDFAFLLVFVCPWSVSFPLDVRHARGLGLILCNDGWDTTSDASSQARPIDVTQPLIRAGLFLMPSFDPDMKEWERRTIKIA